MMDGMSSVSGGSSVPGESFSSNDRVNLSPLAIVPPRLTSLPVAQNPERAEWLKEVFTAVKSLADEVIKKSRESQGC